MAKFNQLDYFAKRTLPDYFIEEGSKLVPFLQYFVDWIQKENNPAYAISTLTDDIDIDLITDDFIIYLKNEVISDFPTSISSDLRKFLKNVLFLYRSKGSVASYQYFFRTLFDSYVKITYPKDYILKCSDGEWINDYYIEFDRDVFPENFAFSSLVGYKITGAQSKATAFITGITAKESRADEEAQPEEPEEDEEENMLLLSAQNEQVLWFQISNPMGTFRRGESIHIKKEFTLEELEEYDTTILFYEKGDGKWQSTRGFLDASNMLLQDSYFYQDFSYVLSSQQPYNDYYEIIKKLLHPAGLKFFGEFQLYEPGGNILYLPAIDLVWHHIVICMLIEMPMETLVHELETYNQMVLKLNCHAHYPFILDYMYQNPEHQMFPTYLSEETVLENFAKKYSNRDCCMVFEKGTGLLIDPDLINFSDLTIEDENYDGDITIVTVAEVTNLVEKHVLDSNARAFFDERWKYPQDIHTAFFVDGEHIHIDHDDVSFNGTAERWQVQFPISYAGKEFIVYTPKTEKKHRELEINDFHSGEQYQFYYVNTSGIDDPNDIVGYEIHASDSIFSKVYGIIDSYEGKKEGRDVYVIKFNIDGSLNPDGYVAPTPPEPDFQAGIYYWFIEPKTETNHDWDRIHHYIEIVSKVINVIPYESVGEASDVVMFNNNRLVEPHEYVVGENEIHLMTERYGTFDIYEIDGHVRDEQVHNGGDGSYPIFNHAMHKTCDDVDRYFETHHMELQIISDIQAILLKYSAQNGNWNEKIGLKERVEAGLDCNFNEKYSQYLNMLKYMEVLNAPQKSAFLRVAIAYLLLSPYGIENWDEENAKLYTLPSRLGEVDHTEGISVRQYDGAFWARIFYQDIGADYKGLFPSKNDAYNYSNALGTVFSRLAVLRDYEEYFQNSDGKYEFLMACDNSSSPIDGNGSLYSRWIQSVNPCHTLYQDIASDSALTFAVDGYELISQSGTDYPYGLSLSTSTQALLDGQPKHSAFNGAIGLVSKYQSGIPSLVSNSRVAQLWVRVDNTKFASLLFSFTMKHIERLNLILNTEKDAPELESVFNLLFKFTRSIAPEILPEASKHTTITPLMIKLWLQELEYKSKSHYILQLMGYDNPLPDEDSISHYIVNFINLVDSYASIGENREEITTYYETFNPVILEDYYNHPWTWDMSRFDRDYKVYFHSLLSNRDSTMVFDSNRLLINPDEINWSAQQFSVPQESGTVYFARFTPDIFTTETPIDEDFKITYPSDMYIKTNFFMYLDGKIVPEEFFDNDHERHNAFEFDSEAQFRQWNANAISETYQIENCKEFTIPLEFFNRIGYTNSINKIREKDLFICINGTPIRHYGYHIGKIYLDDYYSGRLSIYIADSYIDMYNTRSYSLVTEAEMFYETFGHPEELIGKNIIQFGYNASLENETDGLITNAYYISLPDASDELTYENILFFDNRQFRFVEEWMYDKENKRIIFREPTTSYYRVYYSTDITVGRGITNGTDFIIQKKPLNYF